MVCKALQSDCSDMALLIDDWTQSSESPADAGVHEGIVMGCKKFDWTLERSLFNFPSRFCSATVLTLIHIVQLTDTPAKSVKRYLRTLHHLMLWHTGDIFKVGSPAHESLCEVRAAHKRVRESLNANASGECPDGTKTCWISQFNMVILEQAMHIWLYNSQTKNLAGISATYRIFFWPVWCFVGHYEVWTLFKNLCAISKSVIECVKNCPCVNVLNFLLQACVQSGFMGLLVLHSKKFGIRASEEELEDYIYFWRCIG